MGAFETIEFLNVLGGGAVLPGNIPEGITTTHRVVLGLIGVADSFALGAAGAGVAITALGNFKAFAGPDEMRTAHIVGPHDPAHGSTVAPGNG